MAGIGFEIRKIMRRDTLLSLLEAYGYAGLIGSGPWVLSVLGVMLIGILSLGRVVPQSLIVQFLVSVTYLMACSLILTGALQLVFTRFIADRLFEKKTHIILGNVMGAVWITVVTAGLLGGLILWLFFEGTSLLYRLIMLANFVVLSGMWITVIFLSSMKQYRTILLLFFLGYGSAIVSAFVLGGFFKLPGLLAGVLIGHSILFFGLLFIILREYPGRRMVYFHFTRPSLIYPSLIFAGLFFNMGVWADKFIFWFTPETSQQIIGPLRASMIYDLPIFLAYLSIIPGMAVFMVRMEADFAEQYDNFYSAVREGNTLKNIYYFKNQMVYTARRGIYEIFKIQGLTVIILLLWGKDILEFIGISGFYLPLFYVDVIGVSVQVLLLALLNITFYLDYRRIALILTVLFLVSNIVFTWLSIQMGAIYYGYGFALAVTLTVLVGLWLLNKKMAKLEYETFMLQGQAA